MLITELANSDLQGKTALMRLMEILIDFSSREILDALDELQEWYQKGGITA